MYVYSLLLIFPIKLFFVVLFAVKVQRELCLIFPALCRFHLERFRFNVIYVFRAGQEIKNASTLQNQRDQWKKRY